MTLRRIIFRTAVRFLEKLLLIKPLSAKNKKILQPEADSLCDIITISFNNPFIIEEQIRLTQKYFPKNHRYIVADNSTDKQAQAEIKNLCQKNDIMYIKVPKNRLGIFGGSYSHAGALNWAYHYIVKTRQATYFGFIDHDIFPIKSFSIAEKINDQPIYGHLRERENFWYLWSGLCFFEYSFLKDKKVDFMPITLEKTYLDSGGGNWKAIYSRMDKNKLSFVSVHWEALKEGGSRHGDTLEYFDDCWLHTINGSYWKKVENKDDLLKQLLKNY